MNVRLKSIQTHAPDFWLARGSVVLIAGLQLLIINPLSLGPRWLAPALELSLLLPLSVATAWTQGKVRSATTDQHWHLIARRRRGIRMAAVGLTALITLMNLGSLFLLVRALLAGHAGTSGQTLLLDAINVWLTNVIAFALWYWSIDRGGPAARGLVSSETCDFLFPQMTLGQSYAEWSPGFIDFSPTDTMPLTSRVKSLMAIEAAISLLTLALVAARAVNILA
jgi:hypothetical protein